MEKATHFSLIFLSTSYSYFVSYVNEIEMGKIQRHFFGCEGAL